MPTRKPSLSMDELLESFGQRVQESAQLPNYRHYTALPQQELFHQSQAQHRILFGGNRAGKTYSGCEDDVEILLRAHRYREHLYADRPRRIRFIGADFDTVLNSAIPIFRQLIPASRLIDGQWDKSFRWHDHKLELADRSTVSFMAYTQEARQFQAVSLDHIHFDEEPPKPIFEESEKRLIDTAGSWTLSETPVQQLEWVEDELINPWKDGLKADLAVFYLSTLENSNLPEAELRKLASLDPTSQEFIVRVQGEYQGGNMVFPEFTRKFPNVIEPADWKLSPAWSVYESMDAGYVNPTAWLWTAVSPQGQIVTFRALYGARIVVEDWAKAVKQMRTEIMREYGLTQQNWHDMYRGAFGDPAIGDSGNATAQTGITIQQAYANEGVYISTEGIRQMRAGNANIGLDKMHSYLRVNPRTGAPWWQILNYGQTTALIDEMKKARKPRQTLQQQDVKNSSEEIRDKDNHAIDAIKYLFMVTHELRPPEALAGDDQYWSDMMAREMHAVPTQPDTHADIFAATMRREPSTYNPDYGDGDGYFAMEE